MSNRDENLIAKVIGNDAGAYLLEALIAMFLLSLAMMGLAQLGYASMVGNRTSQMMTDATALAQQRLDQAKTIGYERIDSLAVTEAYGSIPGYPKYKRQTVVDSSVTTWLKQVIVKVYWSEDKHKFQMQTAVSPK